MTKVGVSLCIFFESAYFLTTIWTLFYGSHGHMFRTLSILIALIVIHSWSVSDLKNIFIKEFFCNDNPLMLTLEGSRFTEMGSVLRRLVEKV